MFVFLSKLLPMFVYPLGLAMLVLVIALIWRRGARALIVLALVLLYLGSNRWVAYSLVHSLEYQHLPTELPPDAGAIVVLGGGSRSGDAPRPMIEINEAGDRLLYGAYLYREGKADHVLLTGGSIEWLTPEGIAAEANDMGSLMEFLGVPRDALWLETQVPQYLRKRSLQSRDAGRRERIRHPPRHIGHAHAPLPGPV